MARIRLRTNTGCQRCRRRKKKCDEIRPVCGACRRWSFPCIWPDQVADADSKKKYWTKPVTSFPIYLEWPLNSHGTPVFRDHTQLSLLHNFVGIYQSFICPLARTEHASPSLFVNVALHETWSRDALNAFTSYMLFTRSGDRHLERSALVLYQSSVLGLKKKVANRLDEADIVGVLVAATFLGLLEVTILHFRLYQRRG